MSTNAESRPAPLHRFEDAAYQGYGVRRSAGPDVELARVGPGTPCGEYLRRFWHPVALSSELADVPVALRILGEDLVVFRDGEGRIGLVHRRCPHRRASLEYGTCRHRGIRCCYHGWHFDIDGTLLDVPGQPPEAQARLKHGVRLGAYPAFEYRGLVFAYLGPPEAIPEFPVYDTFKLPDMEMVPYRAPFRCNWLQVLDAIVDPIHTSFLHSSISREQVSAGFGEIGRIDFFDRGAWLMGTNTRRVGDNVWFRVNELVLPNLTQAGAAFAADGTRQRYYGRSAFVRWVCRSTTRTPWRSRGPASANGGTRPCGTHPRGRSSSSRARSSTVPTSSASASRAMLRRSRAWVPSPCTTKRIWRPATRQSRSCAGGCASTSVSDSQSASFCRAAGRVTVCGSSTGGGAGHGPDVAQGLHCAHQECARPIVAESSTRLARARPTAQRLRPGARPLARFAVPGPDKAARSRTGERGRARTPAGPHRRASAPPAW